MICCHHCGRFFIRNARHQQYCGRIECQKARNAKKSERFPPQKGHPKDAGGKEKKKSEIIGEIKMYC